MDHKKEDDSDVDIQTCFIVDYISPIPSLPQDEIEREAYEDLHPYVIKAISSDRE